jgi:hypothetical protein
LPFKGAVAVVLLALALPACAAEGPPPRFERGEGPPGQGPGGEGPRGVNLFISPAGEPFRAGPADPYPVAAWFARADRNGDGRLTLDEFQADAEHFFRVLDTDKDGVIDGFEAGDYERKIVPEILPRVAGLRAGEGMDPGLMRDMEGRRGGGGMGRGGGGEGGGGRGGRAMAGDRMPQGAAVFGLLSDPQPVAASDSDLSGKITLAEWRAVAARRFDLLDTAHAGYLTLAGLPQTPLQALREPRKGRDNKRPPRR